MTRLVSGLVVLVLAGVAGTGPTNGTAAAVAGGKPGGGSATTTAAATPAERLKKLAGLAREHRKRLGPERAAMVSSNLLKLADLADADIDAMAAAGAKGRTASPAQPAQPLQARTYANNVNAAEDFLSRVAGSTQSEPSAAWCGQNAVIGFNDSGSGVATAFGGASPSGSFSFLGWARSTDAGATFTDRGVLLPDPLPPGVLAWDLGGDPVVGCTSAQNFYYASLLNEETADGSRSGIAVLRSTDGGATFTPPVVAAREGVGHFLDKPWLAVEPGPTAAASDDVLHVTYTDFDSHPGCQGIPGAAIEYVRSTNGGQTWSTPLEIDLACGGDYVQGSLVKVGVGDDVYVAWMRIPAQSNTARTLAIRRSTDLGASFAATVVVTTTIPVGSGDTGFREVQGAFRATLDLQGLAVDQSSGPRRGTVYLTFHSGHDRRQGDPFGFCDNGRTYCFGDVFVTRSTTGGATWSSPVKINAGDQQYPIDQVWPAVEVDSAGAVWALWLDRRRDNRNFLFDAFLGRSTDGGATWSNTQATPANFPPIPGWHDMLTIETYMGDYHTVAVDSLGLNPGVIAAWGDNALGDPNVAYRRWNS